MSNEIGENSVGNHIQDGCELLGILTYADIQGFMWRILEMWFRLP